MSKVSRLSPVESRNKSGLIDSGLQKKPAPTDHKRVNGHTVSLGQLPLRPTIPVQAKLKVNAPGDKYEKEADNVAMETSSGSGGNKNSLKTSISPISASSSWMGLVSPNVTKQIADTKGQGQSIDGQVGKELSHQFGFNFGNVQVHVGHESEQVTGSLGARAIAFDNHIYFNRGEYQPSTTEGRKLLGHELTHIVQQNSAGRRDSIQKAPGTSKETDFVMSVSRILSPDPAESLNELAFGVQTIAAIGPDQYLLQLKGFSFHINGSQRAQLFNTITSQIRKGLGKARAEAYYARAGYDIQKATNDEHWFVSSIVKAFAGSEITARYLFAALRQAYNQWAFCDRALQEGNLVEAAKWMARCDGSARMAKELYRQYQSGIESTGDTIITSLEVTKTVSFVSLGIMATIVSGGAAAGGVGALGSASTANAIATFAPMVATVAEAGSQKLAGEKVDWTKVGVDMIVGAVLSRFGGKMSEAIFARLIGNPAVRSLGKVAFGRIVTGVLTYEASTFYGNLVNAAYRKLRGENITWEQLAEEITQQALDPKAVILAVIENAAIAGVEARQTSRSRKASTASSAPEKTITSDQGIKTDSTVKAPSSKPTPTKAEPPVAKGSPSSDQLQTGPKKSTEPEPSTKLKQQQSPTEATPSSAVETTQVATKSTSQGRVPGEKNPSQKSQQKSTAPKKGKQQNSKKVKNATKKDSPLEPGIEVENVAAFVKAKNPLNPKKIKAAKDIDSDGSHTFSDHGAHTTAAEHKTRLLTGRTPSGRQPKEGDGPPTKSGQFSSDEKQMQAYKQAYERMHKEKYKLDGKESKVGSLERVTFAEFPLENAGISYSLDKSGNLIATPVSNVLAVFRFSESLGRYYLVTMYPVK